MKYRIISVMIQQYRLLMLQLAADEGVCNSIKIYLGQGNSGINDDSAVREEIIVSHNVIRVKSTPRLTVINEEELAAQTTISLLHQNKHFNLFISGGGYGLNFCRFAYKITKTNVNCSLVASVFYHSLYQYVGKF